MSFWRKTPVHILLVVLTGLAAYSGSFDVPFQYDDSLNIAENPLIKSPDLFFHPSKYCAQAALAYDEARLCRSFTRRYVGYFAFFLNYRLGGLNVAGYHIFNLVIHIINALLVYALVILTFRTPLFRIQLIALLSALLFVSHPIQTQAVTYIVQRFTSLATLFSLLALVLYIKARQNAEDGSQKTDKKQGTINVQSVFCYLASVISAVLAMKTKEIAFTLPFMIALYEFLFFEGRIKRRVFFLMPLFLTMIIIPLGIVGIDRPFGGLIGVADSATRELTPISRSEYLFTEFRVIVTYLRLLILPINQNLDYDYPVHHSFFTFAILSSCLLHAAIIGLGMYCCRRSMGMDRGLRLISFGIFWFYATLSVESSIIPIEDVIAEHRVYLPSAGIFIAISASVAFLVGKSEGRRRAIRFATIGGVSAMIIGLAGATYARNVVWTDEIKLWEDVVQKSPAKARGYTALGKAYFDRGQFQEARNALTSAIKFNPYSARAYNYMGMLQFENAQLNGAMAMYKKSLALRPGYPDAHNNLGIVYSKRGEYHKALEEYANAIKNDPHHAKAYNNRGLDYSTLGRPDKAIEDFTLAISNDQNYADAYVNRGGMFFKMRRYDRALDDFSKAVIINPDHADALANRCFVFLTLNRYDEAIADCNKAILMNAQHADAYVNRGMAYEMKGLKNSAAEDYRKACDRGGTEGCKALRRIERAQS